MARALSEARERYARGRVRDDARDFAPTRACRPRRRRRRFQVGCPKKSPWRQQAVRSRHRARNCYRRNSIAGLMRGSARVGSDDLSCHRKTPFLCVSSAVCALWYARRIEAIRQALLTARVVEIACPTGRHLQIDWQRVHNGGKMQPGPPIRNRHSARKPRNRAGNSAFRAYITTVRRTVVYPDNL